MATRREPGGGAVQDAGGWWDVITATTRRALGSGAVDPEQVVAVCCTGQWSSTVPVDAGGIPVGDCVMWMDTRGGRYVREAVGGPVAGYSPLAAARWIQRTGGAPDTDGADPLGHMLFIEREQPDVARRGPLVPRAGRLPLHALHGRCRRRRRPRCSALGSPTTASPTGSSTT